MSAQFLLRIAASADSARVGEEIRVGRGLVIGREAGCTIVLADTSVSRQHARAERTDEGVRITDLDSRNGIWLATGRVPETLLHPGERCRIGSTVFECRREVAAVALEADDRTILVRLPSAGEAAKTPASELARRLQMGALVGHVGETQDLDPHQPFLLNEPATAWQVLTGSVLIFTVALDEGAPVGGRTHFADIAPGQWFFAFDAGRYADAFGVLAVPAQDTRVRRVPLAQLQVAAGDTRAAEAMASLLDPWIRALTRALAARRPSERRAEALLTAASPIALDPGRRASSADGVVWVKLSSGTVLFNDIACPVFDASCSLFPVTPDSRIETIGDTTAPLSLAPAATRDVAGDPRLWPSLQVFHQAVCECEVINRKLAVADEYLRLEEKAQKADEAALAGYAAIGSVLEGGAATTIIRSAAPGESVLRACQHVGRAAGIGIKPHPGAQESFSFEQQVAAIASASGFRTRLVALRDEWWKDEHGALLGQRADNAAAVALLPAGRHGYIAVDPQSGVRTPVDAKLAQTLAPFGYAFYRPAPDSARVVDLLRFGIRGIGRDVWWIALTACVLGLLGTVGPYLFGQVLDTAVPQADRGLLFGFGAALLASAIATSLYRFVQDVATIRVETRMTAAIQSAVWDRILNLPVGFFRQFAAGDLAERAGGVATIQRLVAGAGVAAVLGSISGLFYVAQIFLYDARLALLGIALTALFVGVNTTVNYAQIRYQRDGMQVRGRIAGLTLNLLTGVSKIRIAGAEQHAFRVWAEQFARQRRLAYTAGTIQNVAGVFNGVYPVLANMAIFIAVIVEQGRLAAQHAPMLTTGEFVGFTTAFGLFVAAMQSLGDASMSLVQVVPVYERFKPILTTPTEIDQAREFPGTLTGALELSRVSFRYGPDMPWVIKDLSLTIKPGEFVAFVGPSGCGKSTLMRLMLGFEQPSAGSIRYDDRDLAALDVRMVRQQIGVVLQTSRVMPAEIFRNIVGVSFRPMQDAWEAAANAGLADDIQQMPMGMQTYVSENGTTLSGGQRQRLMIARAIVNKPRILFLDEATSALDNRTQAVVTESMKRMKATRIVIAHRLTTIMDADRICYLEGGRIAEMGTYRQLMARNGSFARLARRQVA